MENHHTHAGRRSLILGISGQDGHYLAEQLLAKGYEVHGVVRRAAHGRQTGYGAEAAVLDSRVTLHRGDLDDLASLLRIVREVAPHEIYNFGTHGCDADSFEEPEHALLTDGLGSLHLLEAIRLSGRQGDIRYFQATSAAVFGGAVEVPLTEAAAFQPDSPYGVAKACGHWLTQIYRRRHGLFACSGIMFGHESPLRSRDGVLRRITYGLASAVCGLSDRVELPCLDARYDLGCATDYVRAAWLMLQQAQPDDYVVATGTLRSARELTEIVAEEMGLRLSWRREGEWEYGLVAGAVGAASGLFVGRALIRSSTTDVAACGSGLVGDSSAASRGAVF